MPEPKMLFVGPFKDFSGYAEASRNYVEALSKDNCNLVARHLNYDGAKFEPSKLIKEVENKDLQDINIIVQQTTPNETERKDGSFAHDGSQMYDKQVLCQDLAIIVHGSDYFRITANRRISIDNLLLIMKITGFECDEVQINQGTIECNFHKRNKK